MLHLITVFLPSCQCCKSCLTPDKLMVGVNSSPQYVCASTQYKESAGCRGINYKNSSAHTTHRGVQSTFSCAGSTVLTTMQQKCPFLPPSQAGPMQSTAAVVGRCLQLCVRVLSSATSEMCLSVTSHPAFRS